MTQVAWPMRAACAHLADPHLNPIPTQPNDSESADSTALLEGLREFIAIYYNRTNVATPCLFNGPAKHLGLPHVGGRNAEGHAVRLKKPMTRRQRDGAILHREQSPCQGTWGYQYCTQMVQPFASGLGQDIFYPASPWNVSATVESCRSQYNVQARPEWGAIGMPGSRLGAGRFSKIVFTNGYLDPWSGGGVLDNISHTDELTAFILPNGAHHLDFMFSHDDDPPDAVAAREFIERAIKRWVGEGGDDRVFKMQ